MGCPGYSPSPSPGVLLEKSPVILIVWGLRTTIPFHPAGFAASAMTIPAVVPEGGLSADEMVDIVDENNQVIGQEKRIVMRRQKLRHRSTYIFCRNSKGQFYVQKRTMIKDYCPGYYETVSGGVVGAGETYEENAFRELEEEMGVSGVPLEHLFTFYYEDDRVKVFGDAWDCVYDGELKLQETEVESVHLMTMDEIFERVEAGDQFTPDSLVAARKYIEYRQQQQASSS